MTAMLQAASPRTIMALSFQWPYFTLALIYSSARLMPPVKPTLPSMTMIFRWSRLFSRMVRIGTKGLNTQHLMPVLASRSLA